MDTKYCPRCETRKPLDEFGRNGGRKDGRQVYCLSCWREYRMTDAINAVQKAASRDWYARNAERVLAGKKAEYQEDIEGRRAKAHKANRDPEEYARHLARVLERGRALRAEVFGHYGSSCECCREANPGFLTIDHIDGCTKEQRKSQGGGSSFYNWLRTNGFPPGFRTLCANCNLGRASNVGGACPHKLRKFNATAHHRRLKSLVFEHYGRRCSCCGESNPGFLSIDHINGCTAEMRKVHGNGTHFYRWLRRNGFPEGFRTLCLNCNCGRAWNGGICPHVAIMPGRKLAPADVVPVMEFAMPPDETFLTQRLLWDANGD